jgi:hypothetical protein
VAAVLLSAWIHCSKLKTGNSLLLVPERKGNIHAAVGVRNTSNAILAPTESSRASHVVGEVTPSISIVAVLCQIKKLELRMW